MNLCIDLGKQHHIYILCSEFALLLLSIVNSSILLFCNFEKTNYTNKSSVKDSFGMFNEYMLVLSTNDLHSSA